MDNDNALASVWTEPIENWEDLLKEKESLESGWTFRGQSQDWRLKTSLDRACDDFKVSENDRPNLERELIRDFQRKYRGDDSDLVVRDVAYCLSLMQHYGAPTRFLDATYSFYVAIFFALESSDLKKKESNECEFPVVWCIRSDWMGRQAKKRDNSKKLKIDRTDEERGTKTFEKIYMRMNKRSDFVYKENPLKLNERAIVQQSVFWCPADISKRFDSNIAAMKGREDKANVRKFRLKFLIDQRVKAFEQLQRMNITHASLFPGMEGFSRGFRLNLPLYVNISKDRKGNPPSKSPHLPIYD